jgi:hypothetical protein
MNSIIVPKIAIASAIIQKTNPLSMLVIAVAILPTDGYLNPRLEPRIYVRPPADGFYEFDFYLDEPRGPAADKLTPYTAAYEWVDFPVNDVKGVKVYGQLEPKTAAISD